jgi:hypothetical protein
MKNEPVVTYNHMEEESAVNHYHHARTQDEQPAHPISLYMLFVVDIIVMCAIVMVTIKVIF